MYQRDQEDEESFIWKNILRKNLSIGIDLEQEKANV